MAASYLPFMATDLHTLTAPVFIRALTNLDKILDKGRAFAAEKGIDETELLEALERWELLAAR